MTRARLFESRASVPIQHTRLCSVFPLTFLSSFGAASSKSVPCDGCFTLVPIVVGVEGMYH